LGTYKCRAWGFCPKYRNEWESKWGEYCICGGRIMYLWYSRQDSGCFDDIKSIHRVPTMRVFSKIVIS
jgi:hypothetical protein